MSASQYSFSCPPCCGSSSSGYLGCPSYSTPPPDVPVTGSLTDTATGVVYQVEGYLSYSPGQPPACAGVLGPGAWYFTNTSASGDYADVEPGTPIHCVTAAEMGGATYAVWATCNEVGCGSDPEWGINFTMHTVGTTVLQTITMGPLPLTDLPSGTVGVCFGFGGIDNFTGSVTFG